jgi:deoxyadenosine kinase
MGQVVIIEGLMGAGKSTLTVELGRALGANTLILLEPDEEKAANPYLGDFYADMGRWAFPMQVHMLAARYRHALHAQWHTMNGAGFALCDKSLYGDTCFARLMLRQNHITPTEFDTYRIIYENYAASVLPPSVCIRLRMDPAEAHRRIQKRAFSREGRRFESTVGLDYLYALDREIDITVDALRGSGVKVLDVFWGENRETEDARREVVATLASDVLAAGNQSMMKALVPARVLS